MPSAPEAELVALRHSVAISRMPHVHCLRGVGSDAFDVLDRLCTSDLFVRDGQVLHTLLLQENAEPFADAYLCCDDEDPILLFEGPTPDAMLEHLARHTPADLQPAWSRFDATHAFVSLNGPYAWELLARLVGSDVVGLPYRTFFHLRGELQGICFRAGKTGEFGYDLLLDATHIDSVVTRLLELGADLDVREAGLAALDQCALENGFFCIRAGSLVGLTPLELQLQWRLSTRKAYLGSAVIDARRQAGPGVRATFVRTEPGVEAGAAVRFGETRIGTIHAMGLSPLLGCAVGLALLDVRYACAGIARYEAERSGGWVPLRTCSAPLLDNRSLYVDSRNDSYRTREERVYPAITR